MMEAAGVERIATVVFTGDASGPSEAVGQIAKTLRNKMPDQVKHSFYLWTREAAVALVDRRFGLASPRPQ